MVDYKYAAPERPDRIKNLIGKRFDKLLVLRLLGMTNKVIAEPVWECLCDCGTVCEQRSSHLRRNYGIGKSCGCSNKTAAIDITNQRYGKLVAVSCTGKKNSNGSYIWLFKCDCGNFVERGIGNLRNKPDSAKCHSCNLIQIGNRNRTHGTAKSDKVYKTWYKIKERCFNPNDKSYKDYGAKGISIQENWINDFVKFRDYIGNPPEDGQRWSIDRIDNSLGYQEGNIRWATDHQQARNKTKMRNNKTGVNGVNFEDKKWPNSEGSTMYAVAQWKGLNGEPNKKCFSFKKYGEELAFFMACEYREQMIALLNLQGAGYSENHGK